MPQIQTITTDNPERETWRYLQLFSNESHVSKLVTQEIAKDQIVSCIRQAAEIYSLSKSTSVLTKPVLLYYGMQRLAKALIFLKNPDVKPDDLRHHGLNGRRISDRIEKFWDNVVSKTKTGIFPEFSKWTTNNNILFEKTVYEKEDYHHKALWVDRCDISDFLDASTFKTYDLFSLVPELTDLFHFFGMENLLLSCGLSIRQRSSGKLDCLLTVEKKLELDSLKTKFPTIKKYNDFKEKPNSFIFTSREKDEIEIPNPLVQAENKNLFLVASTSNHNRISDMNVHFILMFLLCHIARYKAPLLKQIMEGREKSENIALIEKFIEVSETKFPKLILDELVGQYFTFRER